MTALNTARTFRSAAELAEAQIVKPERLAELERVAARYAMAITPTMAELIGADNEHDPIARQLVPDVAELNSTEVERVDPIGDHAHEVVPGLIHRYPDRVLLKLANVCAVYCRFCFRREMVGPGQRAHLSDAEIEAALAYIAAHPEIWEVIVSGGDPLVLSPRRLALVSTAIAAIPHVKVLRWHSRVPLVAPVRVDDELVGALAPEGVATWIAIHANHPREFSDAGCAALARIANAGIPMVSQSVLLKDVNDDAGTLAALMRAFVENRVKPYYLHHGDLAPGTSHFRTDIREGRALMKEMRGTVSGLCQPTYVLDLPGGHGKVPIGPYYLSEESSSSWSVEDPKGGRHIYPPSEEVS
jgi:lysine 2,3-aminomutase